MMVAAFVEAAAFCAVAGFEFAKGDAEMAGGLMLIAAVVFVAFLFCEIGGRR